MLPRRRGWGRFGWVAAAGLATMLVPAAAEARQRAQGSAAPSAIRATLPRPAVAPPVRPLQPAGVTWTPNPGTQGAMLPHAGARGAALRRVPMGYRPAYAAGLGARPVAPAPAPPVAAARAAEPLPVPVAAAPACPPPPPQVWIGGRLWVPDHQACDGTMVAGRWGSPSPFGAIGN